MGGVHPLHTHTPPLPRALATPNLHTFKTDFLSVDTINTVPTTTNDFQCVLMTNKIKTFDLCHNCTLKKIKLIVDLFSQLEFLKIGTTSKEIEPIVHYVLFNRHNMLHLYFLCLFEVSVMYVKKLIELFEKQKLLDDYFITCINRNLYLWW